MSGFPVIPPELELVQFCSQGCKWCWMFNNLAGLFFTNADSMWISLHVQWFFIQWKFTCILIIDTQTIPTECKQESCLCISTILLHSIISLYSCRSFKKNFETSSAKTLFPHLYYLMAFKCWLHHSSTIYCMKWFRGGWRNSV